MELTGSGLKKAIAVGLAAGILWGWIAMTVNFFSGVFPFENIVIQNIVNFAAAGAILGIVTTGFLAVAWRKLPFKGTYARAVFVSTSLWILFVSGGALLSMADPSRFHRDIFQTMQGLLLAVTLGWLIGVLWRIQEKREA